MAGQAGSRRMVWRQECRDWQDRKTGEFVRAVTLPDDVELLTRHEVQAAPPDLLVTNYSMLEYMLMRPIERHHLRQDARLARKESERKIS